MKRLLVLAVVGLLVVGAGCAMTSPEADQARQTDTQTPTTTSGSQSNPHGSEPVGDKLPDGYTEDGIQDVSLAYEQHMAVLESSSFHLTYLENSSNTDGTLQAITNGSGPDQRWHATIGTRNGPITEEIYQDGDTRYVRQTAPDGLKSVENTTESYVLTDGVVGNESLENVLSKLEVSSPRAMTQGNSTFVFYKVDAYGDTSVSGGHLVILPNGQIRIIYLKFDNTEIAYTAVNKSVTVQEPGWIDSSA